MTDEGEEPVKRDDADRPDVRDIFLSHSSADKPTVRRIAADIAKHRCGDGRPLTVWLDEAEIRPGESIVGAVNAGLESSSVIALALSPAYFRSRSGWTDAEWHAALHRDPDNRRGRILPILIADCPRIPILLRHLRIIDLRKPTYPQGLQEFVRVVRGDPHQVPAIYRGQLIWTDHQVSRQTLVAERSVVDAEPDACQENLSCNLLPVDALPTRVYTAPVLRALAGRPSLADITLPSKDEVKQAIRYHQEALGKTPFTPAFRMVEDRIVSFHDLTSADGVFSPVIDETHATSDPIADWLQDSDDRLIVTSLLNMALSRHAYRHALQEDPERPHRFYFTPREGGSRSITWKPFRTTRSREVAGPRHDDAGNVVFWRHAAAHLRMLFLAAHYYLHVDPTWVFTEDGEKILRGAELGSLASRWSGAERNLHILYHIRFWAHALRSGPGPIQVRAGDQTLSLSSAPAFIHQQFGIAGDVRNLDHGLDTWADRIERLEETIAELEAEERLAAHMQEETDGRSEAREEVETSPAEDETDARI